MSEAAIRFSLFFIALVVFSALEFFFQYRMRNQSRKARWPANLSMIFVGALVAKVAFPTGLAFFSELASSNNIGLFNFFNLNIYSEIIISVILLDLLIYIQHVLTHKIDILWKFHRVHHADTDLDATSALRFHPLEILASLGYKAFWILVFGFSYQAIFVFEIILNFMAMFNHSNIRLPKKVETFLRLFVVTPQMHIIHHSVEQNESDTNYGFSLSIWDRLFKTYTNSFSSKGVIGQTYYRKSSDHGLWSLLKLPFKKV